MQELAKTKISLFFFLKRVVNGANQDGLQTVPAGWVMLCCKLPGVPARLMEGGISQAESILGLAAHARLL